MTQSHHDLGEARPRGEKDTIRSLSRSIHVIQAINRYGSLGLSEIAKAANVPMPTAFRIINTLIEEGLVERERERRKYRPTALIQTLACGFQNHDRLVNAARTVMSDFTHLHHWPLSIVTRVGNRMVVRYHTAAQTTLTYNNYYPGWQVPILASASGQVYVAYTDELTRARLIDSAAELEEAYGQYMLEQFQSGAATRRIRADATPRSRSPGTRPIRARRPRSRCRSSMARSSLVRWRSSSLPPACRSTRRSSATSRRSRRFRAPFARTSRRGKCPVP
ncbi:helix-turn-helix domain-containing protein [Novosphingobium sp. MBES04]|uniref:helix-turn-helix domain-containing protein n=1 Tax=Novosphingobium sp. MBES04 TaxID=1206458 RepID=UPI000A07B982|nr:helix-turn-helix domain-containing protein [Novosphingobium sp. MBES04]